MRTAENGKQAIKTYERLSFAVALIDIELSDMKGTELLERLKRKQPKMVKIIITGFPSLDNAIGALNEGAAARASPAPKKVAESGKNGAGLP